MWLSQDKTKSLCPVHSLIQICTQEQFNNAMALVGSEFKAKVKYFSDVWVPAIDLAEAATKTQFEVIPVGVVTPTPYCYLGYIIHVKQILNLSGCDLNNWLLTLILLIHQNGIFRFLCLFSWVFFLVVTWITVSSSRFVTFPCRLIVVCFHNCSIGMILLSRVAPRQHLRAVSCPSFLFSCHYIFVLLFILDIDELDYVRVKYNHFAPSFVYFIKSMSRNHIVSMSPVIPILLVYLSPFDKCLHRTTLFCAYSNPVVMCTLYDWLRERRISAGYFSDVPIPVY